MKRTHDSLLKETLWMPKKCHLENCSGCRFHLRLGTDISIYLHPAVCCWKKFAGSYNRRKVFALICVTQNFSCRQLHLAKICCVEMHQATFFALSCVQRTFFALACTAQKNCCWFLQCAKIHACGCCQRKFFRCQRHPSRRMTLTAKNSRAPRPLAN